MRDGEVVFEHGLRRGEVLVETERFLVLLEHHISSERELQFRLWQLRTEVVVLFVFSEDVVQVEFR